jgi:hypothetical protein
MELFAAALFQRKVLVIQRRNNVVLLYPGTIEQYDDERVRINSVYYKRNECDFHVL